MRLAESSRLTPIPFEERVSSLSAILLDESYYRFILDGRRELEGLSWIGEDRLTPLKAHPWLDLGERKTRGEAVDSKNIRKHANDVIRLSQLLLPESRIRTTPKIAEDLDLERFLKGVTADKTYSISASIRPCLKSPREIALAYQLKHS